MRIDFCHNGSPAARLLAVAAALALVTGCADDGYGKRYPVSGTVTYGGKPLEKGSINFIANDAATGRNASGLIVDGNYSLTTFTPGDGALAGQYRVSIAAAETDLSEAEAVAKASGGAALREDLVAKAAMKKSKRLIPAKYGLPDTSGLTREVKQETNTLNFDLTD